MEVSKAQRIYSTIICTIMDAVSLAHPKEFFAITEHGGMGAIFLVVFVVFNLFVLWSWYNYALDKLKQQ